MFLLWLSWDLLRILQFWTEKYWKRLLHLSVVSCCWLTDWKWNYSNRSWQTRRIMVNIIYDLIIYVRFQWFFSRFYPGYRGYRHVISRASAAEVLGQLHLNFSGNNIRSADWSCCGCFHHGHLLHFDEELHVTIWIAFNCYNESEYAI